MIRKKLEQWGYNPLGTWTLTKRESKRFLKVYVQTIFSPAISNFLYLAVFGISLHKAIPNVQGVDYLTFLVSGLIAMSFINNAIQNPSSSLVIAKFQGIISDLMTIPLRRVEILAAFLASACYRAFIVGGVSFLAMFAFVDFTFDAIGYLLISSLLIGITSSSLGIILGIWSDEFERITFVQNFILRPLVYLGGVFYPIQNLPELWKKVSLFNPIVYMIDAMRYGFVGISTIAPSTNLLVLLATSLVTTAGAYIMIRTGYKLQT